MSNKLIIAAAGSGKTTFLVNEALKQKDGRVLITTYTQANEAEIRKRVIEENLKINNNNYIPENITIQTWFSFLLKHGVRPFQGVLFDKKIKGLILVNEQSGLKYKINGKIPVYFKEETEFEHHYFTSDLKIYSDKLSKFVFRCNEKSDASVIDRISRIYQHIYIDEVQDLAGYDLELLKLLFTCNSEILLVGDPRQGTYSTNSSSKNKQFKKAQIVYFFEDGTLAIEKDQKSLLINYRSIPSICDLSNKLFPDFPKTTSGNLKKTEHDGVFFVKESDVAAYLKKYNNTIQLRDSKRTDVNENYEVMNFGEAKGLSFDRVLIYPTKPFLDWLKDINAELAPTSRSKFYVAITRARYSVGIIYNYKANTNVDGIFNYE